jgi:HSP20 family molecular chaperone IbpA
MSATTTKSLLLSQPKAGQFEGEQVTSLTHELEHKETFTEIKVEVPGVDPATISVEFDNNTLHVTCPRGVFTLPVDPTVEISKIKADIVWGMLTLTVPLPKAPESRSIKVNVSDTVKHTTSKTQAKVAEEA